MDDMAEKRSCFLLLSWIYILTRFYISFALLCIRLTMLRPHSFASLLHTYFFLDAHSQSKREPHSQGCSYTMQINANDIIHGNTM